MNNFVTAIVLYIRVMLLADWPLLEELEPHCAHCQMNCGIYISFCLYLAPAASQYLCITKAALKMAAEGEWAKIEMHSDSLIYRMLPSLLQKGRAFCLAIGVFNWRRRLCGLLSMGTKALLDDLQNGGQDVHY